MCVTDGRQTNQPTDRRDTYAWTDWLIGKLHFQKHNSVSTPVPAAHKTELELKTTSFISKLLGATAAVNSNM